MNLVLLEFMSVEVTPLPSGMLSGTVYEGEQPATPVSRRVQVFTTSAPAGVVLPGAVVVRQTASDKNGNWEVRALDPALKYHAIAYDHTGQYDPVIKLNLIPTVD